MILTTKYAIGETVMVRVNRKFYEKCPFCNGIGYKYIKVDGEKSKRYCQNCEGEGKYTTTGDEFIYAPGEITGMFYRISDDMDEFAVEDYEKIEKGYGHEIEYYVRVDDDKYNGMGTYHEYSIRADGEVNEGDKVPRKNQ